MNKSSELIEELTIVRKRKYFDTSQDNPIPPALNTYVRENKITLPKVIRGSVIKVTSTFGTKPSEHRVAGDPCYSFTPEDGNGLISVPIEYKLGGDIVAPGTSAEWFPSHEGGYWKIKGV